MTAVRHAESATEARRSWGEAREADRRLRDPETPPGHLPNWKLKRYLAISWCRYWCRVSRGVSPQLYIAPDGTTYRKRIDPETLKALD